MIMIDFIILEYLEEFDDKLSQVWFGMFFHSPLSRFIRSRRFSIASNHHVLSLCFLCTPCLDILFNPIYGKLSTLFILYSQPVFVVVFRFFSSFIYKALILTTISSLSTVFQILILLTLTVDQKWSFLHLHHSFTNLSDLYQSIIFLMFVFLFGVFSQICNFLFCHIFVQLVSNYAIVCLSKVHLEN